MKDIEEMGSLINEVVDIIRNMHYEEGIPNQTMLNDNEFILNVNLGPRVDDLFISIHVYHAVEDDYVADYVLFHSQPTYYYPEQTTQDNMLFSINGAPKGAVITTSTTFESESLHSAIDEGFSYLMNNIEDILKRYYYTPSQRL